jgi:hypothetical protein
MWILLGLRTASAWCSEDFIVEPAIPGPYIAWPADSPGHVDTIVVLFDYVEIGEVVLRDEEDQEIPTVRYDLTSLDGTYWAVLDPIDTLNAGEYWVGFQRFQLGGRIAPEGAAPVPVGRTIASEVLWMDPRCPEEAVLETGVEYMLCDPAMLTLVAMAETEPPVPTLAETGPVQLGSGASVSYSEGLWPGTQTTLWLGSFDAAGRFTGWTADPLQMPPIGTRSHEWAAGYDGFANSPCPDSGTWLLDSSQTCETWSYETEDCNVSESPEPRRCGCATGYAGALPLTALFLLVCLHRPSGRPWRSRARA